VYQLDYDNFYEMLNATYEAHSKRGWLINFQSHKCKNCQKMTKFWPMFAKEFSPYVNFAQVDCAADKNDWKDAPAEKL